ARAAAQGFPAVERDCGGSAARRARGHGRETTPGLASREPPTLTFMARTLLLTGAAGFIGSHTAQALLARRARVIGLDNFNGYYDPARKRANVREIVEASADREFSLVEGDVRDAELVARLFREYRFDAVVHLAAMAGVRASVDDPRGYYDVNLGG